MAGDYAVWNYFQSVESQANEQFVTRFKQKYGEDRVTDDPIEAGYFGVYLWAQAVEDAGTADVAAVRSKLGRQSFAAPEGIVSIEDDNQHTWKTVRVGRIREDGQFDIVWTSGRPVRPVPYPVYRSRREWNEFLEQLYDQWDGQWANPGP
jgi:urea transport system substrate-binding protein